MLSRLVSIVGIVSLVVPCIAQQNSLGSELSRDVLPDAPSVRIADSATIRFPTHTQFDTVLVPRKPDSVIPIEGTRVTLILASQVTSKSPSGAVFQARLAEPLISNGAVLLPEGTLFQGHLQTRHAGRLMRPGSMFMSFDQLVLPNGTAQNVDLHLLSAESDAIKSDSEGRLHPTLSKKRLAIQLGGTGLAAKFSDDLAEVIGGTTVSAGTARLIGIGAAGTFLALQKGREVKLNAGDRIEVEFGRAGSALH